VRGKDTVAALGLGEVVDNGATAVSGHALVAETGTGLGRDGGATDGHTEALEETLLASVLENQNGESPCCIKRHLVDTYRREGLDGLSCQVIPRQVKLGVVDGQAALGAVGATQKRLHRLGHDAVVGAILGVLEEHVGDPVVGKVLRHLASRAGSPLADIALPEQNCC